MMTRRPLHWRHNDHDGVSNHQPNGCLLNRLFRRRSKKTSKLRVTGLCAGNSRGPVNSPHEGTVTRKMFPFDDVIMRYHDHLIFKMVIVYQKRCLYWNNLGYSSMESASKNRNTNHNISEHSTFFEEMARRLIKTYTDRIYARACSRVR